MPLVTPAQVMTLLDVEVEQRHIVQAEADIERIGGVELDDDQVVARLKASDLKKIKWAIAYQAAWLSAQIDIHARLDVLEIAGSTSDGGVKARDELTLTLAPLCRSNLERLSWKTKSTKRLPSTRRRAERFGPITTDSQIVVHTDSVDTFAQLGNGMADLGPWAEDDRGYAR